MPKCWRREGCTEERATQPEPGRAGGLFRAPGFTLKCHYSYSVLALHRYIENNHLSAPGYLSVGLRLTVDKCVHVWNHYGSVARIWPLPHIFVYGLPRLSLAHFQALSTDVSFLKSLLNGTTHCLSGSAVFGQLPVLEVYSGWKAASLWAELSLDLCNRHRLSRRPLTAHLHHVQALAVRTCYEHLCADLCQHSLPHVL